MNNAIKKIALISDYFNLYLITLFIFFIKPQLFSYYLGKLGLKKENLRRYRGKKFKTKGKKDNRGQLNNFKSIWDIENKVSNAGWFQMDTVVGKEHLSSCLVLLERSSKKSYC